MQLENSYILLEHLRFHAFHGVMAQEHVVGNDYDLSLRIGYDVSRAMLSDDVNDTLNYAEVYQEVKAVMTSPSSLLEHVAYRIAERLMQHFPDISSVQVELTKLNPPMGTDGKGAGVSMLFNK